MLAILTIALAADASHTTSIDLFEAGQPGAPDWDAARRGPWTKPYIGWTIDAGQGDGVLDFGDVRFRDEFVTGRNDIDVVMTVRINGIDDYNWIPWDEEINLRLASQPYDPSYVKADPSTRMWRNQPGFYLWDHEITNLQIVGLPWSSRTTVEVVWLAVTGAHDSMASHGLTHCVGTNIDRTPEASFMCGGTDLKLMVIGSQVIQAFPTAPAIAPTPPQHERSLDDDALRDIFNH